MVEVAVISEKEPQVINRQPSLSKNSHVFVRRMHVHQIPKVQPLLCTPAGAASQPGHFALPA